VNIRILAFFPENKSFWEDCAHKLECFVCDFSHELSDNPITQTNWIAKRIKKGNKTHIVALCPTCTTEDPSWIIHRQSEYSLLHVDATADKHQSNHADTAKEAEDFRKLAKMPQKSPVLQGWMEPR
jgi:hypothetical protein